jgi:hypothetical protein
VPLEEVVAIEAYTGSGTGAVRVITPYGRLTVDQILGRQGEMLADDAQAAVLGEPLPDRDPLRLLAELRALRDSGVISAAEFEIRKSAIGRDIEVTVRVACARRSCVANAADVDSASDIASSGRLAHH